VRKCKYPMGATLNEKGMELLGEAFPDGLIPVLSPLSGEAELDGIGETRVYLVNVPLLKRVDPAGYKNSLEIMSRLFGASKDALDEEFTERGLPLRAELVSGVEIDARFLM